MLLSKHSASSLISPCISLITYLIIGSVAVTGCLFVMNGTLLLGNLQAFIRYIWQINDPLSQISQLSSQVQSAFAAREESLHCWMRRKKLRKELFQFNRKR